VPDPNSIDTLELEQIQGNILGGFLKDFQTFLFLNFPDQDSGREWLATVINDVATSDEVITFDKLFKKIGSRRGEEGTVKATWMNIAFSFRGLCGRWERRTWLAFLKRSKTGWRLGRGGSATFRIAPRVTG